MTSKTLYRRRWPDGTKEIIRIDDGQHYWEGFAPGMAASWQKFDKEDLDGILAMKAADDNPTPEWERVQ